MEIGRINDNQYDKTAKMIERAVKCPRFSNYYPQSVVDDIVTRLDEDGVKQRASWTHFYVIEEDENIVACGAIGEFWSSKTESALFSVFVDPDYQGMGYGRKIIEVLQQDEYFKRAKRVEVAASIPAIPFYRKMGYEFKNGEAVFDNGHFALEKFVNV